MCRKVRLVALVSEWVGGPWWSTAPALLPAIKIPGLVVTGHERLELDRRLLFLSSRRSGL